MPIEEREPTACADDRVPVEEPIGLSRGRIPRSSRGGGPFAEAFAAGGRLTRLEWGSAALLERPERLGTGALGGTVASASSFVAADRFITLDWGSAALRDTFERWDRGALDGITVSSASFAVSEDHFIRSELDSAFALARLESVGRDSAAGLDGTVAPASFEAAGVTRIE